MSDPGILERYCSSYYDRHGLYNDGFPCPSDKYCCQNEDGTKACCPITKQPNDSLFNKKYASSSLPSQTVSSQSNFKSTLFNKLSPLDSSSTPSSNSFASSVSSWPFLVTNSTFLMGICAVLGLLVIISIILLICVLKRCMNKKNKENQIKKINLNNQNSSDASNSISPYSRNSSSSCTSTTVTSTSPKTNEIIMCCEEEDDEHQKILTIDPNSGNSTSSSSTINSNIRNNLMLSNRSSNLSDLLQSHRNTFQSHHQTYMNAISSGSSSTALLLNNMSGNTTHTSFSSGSNTNFSQQHAHLNFNDNDIHFDEQEEPDDDRDFIVTTSSNLDFLKSQSLFNSTPLNYYPSLKPIEATNQLNEVKPNTASISTAVSAATTNSSTTTTTTTTTSQINLTSSGMGDFRFSTFLPTIYTKHVELI